MGELTLPLGQSAARRRQRSALLLALLAVGVITVAGLCVGVVRLAPGQVLAALAGWGTPAHAAIVWNLRLPRVLIGLVAGALLGMAGALLGRSYASDLAAPEQSGISAGAVLAMALGGALGIADERAGAALALLALAGAAPPALLLAWLHRRLGARRAMRWGWLLTAGLLLAALVLLASDMGISRIARWIFGALDTSGWPQWRALWPVALAATAGALAFGRMRGTAGPLAGAVLLAAAATPAGTLGFLGLLAPWLARRLARAEDGSVELLSAVAGAGMLLAADLLARLLTLALPSLVLVAELPLGIVTFVGGLPFAWMLLRRGQDDTMTR
jgi:iron complex transport system permease protein